jgi:3-hydroxyacyl-CoA dehydrogenase / 3-hydroxy-2-methylbutyryl-CoA dehydrogenase
MQLGEVRALVTGGTSGLGRATAAALVAAGARVAILGRDPERGGRVARELGPEVIFVQADVVDTDSVQAGLERVTGAFGCLNTLVNCAGTGIIARVLGRQGPADLAGFARVVQVNLIGTFNVLRLAASLMARVTPLQPDGERGVIVNTASIAAQEAQIGQAAYAASKGGIVSMTLPIARELAALGIRVITIAPGLFDTPMIGPLPEAVRASLRDQTPFPKRFGQPQEYAALVLHVIENRMLNGETIRLDGGLRMQAV